MTRALILLLPFYPRYAVKPTTVGISRAAYYRAINDLDDKNILE
jgi:hypothetical protein